MRDNRTEVVHAVRASDRAEWNDSWPARLGLAASALGVLALALRAQVLLQGRIYIIDGVLLYEDWRHGNLHQFQGKNA